jgi:hypothetical protein
MSKSDHTMIEVEDIESSQEHPPTCKLLDEETHKPYLGYNCGTS